MRLLLASIRETPFDTVFFEELIAAAAKKIEVDSSTELSVLLTDDETIRDLNHRYRGKNSPTDVLSFSLDDEVMLGDIVISLDTAESKAAEGEVSLEEEVAFLFVHGLLHLLGYEHEAGDGGESAEAEEMYELQDEIVAYWEKGLAR